MLKQKNFLDNKKINNKKMLFAIKQATFLRLKNTKEKFQCTYTNTNIIKFVFLIRTYLHEYDSKTIKR